MVEAERNEDEDEECGNEDEESRAAEEEQQLVVELQKQLSYLKTQKKTLRMQVQNLQVAISSSHHSRSSAKSRVRSNVVSQVFFRPTGTTPKNSKSKQLDKDKDQGRGMPKLQRHSKSYDMRKIQQTLQKQQFEAGQQRMSLELLREEPLPDEALTKSTMMGRGTEVVDEFMIQKRLSMEGEQGALKQSPVSIFWDVDGEETDVAATARLTARNQEAKFSLPKQSQYQQHHRLAEPLNSSIRISSSNEDNSEFDQNIVATVRDTRNHGPSIGINVTRVLVGGARTCKAVKQPGLFKKAFAKEVYAKKPDQIDLLDDMAFFTEREIADESDDEDEESKERCSLQTAGQDQAGRQGSVKQQAAIP